MIARTAAPARFPGPAPGAGSEGTRRVLAPWALATAVLVPQVLSLLQVTFPGERRRRAMSAYGLVLAAGVAAGQALGGVLVSADLFGAGWRPVFLVNLPAGLA